MKNLVEQHGNVYHVHLHGKHCAICIVDREGLDKMLELGLTWRAKYDSHIRGFYVVTTKRIDQQKVKFIMLHRFLMGFPTGLQIDHVDRNPLNNVTSNLRIVTNALNSQNRKVRNDSTSGVKGVIKNGKYWVATVKANKKIVYSKNFKEKNEAIYAVMFARSKYQTHGSDESVNFLAAKGGPVMTIQELAADWGVSVQTINRIVRNNPDFPVYWAGDKPVIPDKLYKDWMEKHPGFHFQTGMDKPTPTKINRRKNYPVYDTQVALRMIGRIK